MSPDIKLIRTKNMKGAFELDMFIGLLPDEKSKDYIGALQKINAIRSGMRRKDTDLNRLEAELAQVIGQEKAEAFFEAYKKRQEITIRM